MDVQPILSLPALFAYLLKYACKVEVTSKSLADLFKDISLAQDVLEGRDAIKEVARVLLMRTVGEHDKSVMMVCRLLLSEKLYFCSR